LVRQAVDHFKSVKEAGCAGVSHAVKDAM